MSKTIVKLSYTEEMKEQDKLWINEEENTTIMEKLFHQIVNEAKEKGFTGYCDIYQGPGECICEVFENKKEFKQTLDTMESGTMFGFCKPLVEELEKKINK